MKKRKKYIIVMIMLALILGTINNAFIVKAEKNTINKILGLWEGTYLGTTGYNDVIRNISLEINCFNEDLSISGIATIEKGTLGKYYFEGKVDLDDNVIIEGVDWIYNPNNMGFTKYSGKINVDRLSGIVNGVENRTFSFKKVSSDYCNYSINNSLVKDYIGEYDGCSGGENNVVVRRNIIIHIEKINSDGKIEGIAEFSPSEKADPQYGHYGKYRFKGTIDKKYGKIVIKGYDWIKRPITKEGFNFVELRGFININKCTIEGCTDYGIWRMKKGNSKQKMIGVTLNPMGGSINRKSIVVIKGQKYGILPKATQKGCKFLGWFTDKEYGKLIRNNDTVDVDNDITLYAHWGVIGKFKDGETNKVIKKVEGFRDSYFEKNSSCVQGNLAKLSILAASSVYKESYSKDLMDACGFSVNKYVKKKPTETKNDTVSYHVGIKEANGMHIVAVWVKGTGGDYEWVSNWNLGKKGNIHVGFKKASDTLFKEVKSYLVKKGIKFSRSEKVKFWILGHSRGAAVANLFAKSMNNTIGKENVYAYTFATPRVSKKGVKKGCENIFNYLNPGDFVTEVAPKKWGFKRYGIDKPLSMSKKTGMCQYFKKKSGSAYYGFGEKGKKSLLNAFIKYAGKKRSGYFKKKVFKTPEFFCKKGLGYILAGHLAKGLANCAKVCNESNSAKKVFSKMVIDGKVTRKFGYAHTQLSYVAWLDQMYK